MRMRELSWPVLCASVFLCATTSHAQTCQVPGVSVGGSYAFSAVGAGSGTGTTGTTTSTTGTTGSTTSSTGSSSGFSSTEVGTLVSGLSGTGAFASSGTLFLDGSGNIVATPTTPGSVAKASGTYVLNSDCTITATVMDVFGTNTSSVALQGVVLNNGGEIDLGVLQNASTGSSFPQP